jgi:hypothetical protein
MYALYAAIFALIGSIHLMPLSMSLTMKLVAMILSRLLPFVMD